MEKQHPLVIVFYLDRAMMMTPDVIKPFVEYVNEMLAQKNANTLAFFLPTDGEERVECLNPVVIPKIEMDKITKMIADIQKEFSIGEEASKGIPNIEVDADKKECTCEGTGECNCN